MARESRRLPATLSVFIICIAGLLAMFAAVVSVGNTNFQEVLGAGDYREGYEDGAYSSRAKSLQARIGKAIDLYNFYQNVPLGLPPVAVPEDNSMTREGIDLGRRLFFDRRLSLNNTISCAICHVPEMGFTNHEVQVAIGAEGRSGRRNTPTVLNAAYKTRLFHDGRENTLENQIWEPLLDRTEMDNPSVGYVVEKIKNIKDYDGLFEKAFAGRGASMQTISFALAQYQRVLLSGNSRFDRWYYGKQADALTAQEQAGFAVFAGKGQCTSCHTVDAEYALFTDNQWHNTGLGFDEAMRKGPEKTRVQLAPGIFTEMEREAIQSVSARTKRNDLGLYEITQSPYDRWKYVTPTLRNISLTKPYMHNGSFAALEEVIEFYDRGGIPNDLLSPLIKPLGLSAEEKQALVAFLHTLDGSNVRELVSDAFAAPVGELDVDDPIWANQNPFTAAQ